MKSNIKSKKFYKEAEDMEIGWGRYLRSIDELKDKVDKGENITLKEACWVLYGDGHCSKVWGDFSIYCKFKKMDRKKLVWQCWNGVFQDWVNKIRI